MGYAKYVGRVGALALALGIGTAVATPAWAESPSSTESSSSESKAPQKPLQRRGMSQASSDNATSGSGTSGSGTSTSATDDTRADDADDDAESDDSVVVEEAEEPVVEPEEVIVVDDDVEPSEALDDAPVTPSEETQSSATTTPSSDDTQPEPTAAAESTSDPEPTTADSASEDSDAPSTTSTTTYALTATSPAGVPAPAPLVRQPQTPIGVILGGPVALLDIAAKAINMLFSPDPSVPGDSPLLLGVLAFVRREVQRTFFNSTPGAVADAATTSEGLPTRITVLDNDIDPNPGDILTITDYTQAANGAVTLNPDGSFTYTPTAGFSGSDTFTYTISDDASPWHSHGLASLLNGGHSATATVTISVAAAPVNEKPTAVADIATTAEDTPAVIDVRANDTDPDGDALTVTAVGSPLHGTVVVLDGKVNYTPTADYHGTDTFTYTISDGELTDTATVTVTVTPVNDLPVATNDAVTVAGNSTGNLINVLSNDSDPDADALTVTILGTPSHGGSVSVNADSTVAYTPATGFSGTETFTYTVSDGSATSVGTVTVNVTPVVVPVNTPPVAVNDTYTMPTGSTSAVVNVVANDTDPDGDALTVVGVTGAAHGTTTFTGGTITYTPTTGYAGTEVLTYTVSDGTDTATATLTITVPAVIPPNTPPVAVNDSYTMPTGATSAVVDVVANDTDPDSDTLTVVGVTGAAHGTATFTGGTITYTPTTGYAGTETLTYTVSDGTDTATATLTITVPAATPINTPPVAVNDSYTMPAGATSATVNVVSNDTDADSDTLSVTAVTGAVNGTTTFSGGWITYTPTTGYAGTETLTYTVSDGTDNSTATLTITVPAVTPVNQPPVAVNDTYTMPTGSTSAVVNVVANDTDPDNDTLTVTAVTGAAHGTATFTGGTITYTPTTGYAGTETLTYTVSDGTDTSTATLAITVPAIVVDNHAPVVGEPAYEYTTKHNSGIISGTLDVTDEDGDDLTFTVSGLPGADIGRLAVDPETGAWQFKPTNQARFEAWRNPGETVATFSIVVSDGQDSITIAVAAQISPAFDLGPGEAPDIVDAKTVVLFSSDGRLFVENADGLSVISADGTASAPILLGFRPTDAAFGSDGRLYVTDPVTDSISVVDPATGVVSQFASSPNASGIAFDSDGQLFVASAEDRTITIFGADGSIADVIDIDAIPTDVAVGADGTIYVAEISNDRNSVRLTVRNSDGTVAAVLYERISTPLGGYARPLGLAVDTNGAIYLTDTNSGELSTFTSDGRLVSTRWVDGMTRAVGVGPDGQVMLVSALDNHLYVLTPEALSYDQDYDYTINWDTNVVSGEVYILNPDGHLTFQLTSVPPAALGTVTVDEVTGAWVFTPSDEARAAAAYGEYDWSYDYVQDVDFVITASDGTQFSINAPIFGNVEYGVGVIGEVGGSPTGVAIGADGRLYVADRDQHTITILDSDGDVLRTIELDFAPVHVATVPTGYIIVTNGIDSTLTVITPSGQVVYESIGVDAALGTIAVTQGTDSVFMAVADTDSVSIYRNFAVLDLVLDVPNPTGIAWGSDQELYVVGIDDDGAGYLRVFDSNGDLQTTTLLGGSPSGIALGPNDHLYITDSDGLPRDLAIADSYGWADQTLDLGIEGTAVTVGPDGRVYIADPHAGTVTVLTPPNAPPVKTPVGTVSTIKTSGTGSIYAIAVAPDGRIIVTALGDPGSIVGVLEDDGSVTKLTDASGLAAGVEVGPDGRMYVSDSESGTVTAYDPANGFAPEIIATVPGAIGLAFDSAGSLYIASISTEGVFGGSLVIVSPNGDTRTVALPGSSYDVQVGDGGRVFVTYVSPDYTDAGILVFNTDGTTDKLDLPAGIIPAGVAIGPDGTVFVTALATSGNGQLIVRYPNGITRAIQTDGQPFGMDFDADGRLLITNIGSGTITVLEPTYDPVNEHTPTVQDDQESHFTGTAGVVSGAVIGADLDGDLLTYSAVSEIDPAIGAVIVDPRSGEWQFTPTEQARIEAGTAWNDPAAERPSVTFSILATDGEFSESVTITVEIIPQAPPVAEDPAFSILNVDLTSGLVSGLVHVVDLDGDYLHYELSGDMDSAIGNVYVSSYSGAWEFLPTKAARDAAYLSGGDEVTFIISASDGGNVVLVTVTAPVSPNTGPHAESPSFSIISTSASTGQVEGRIEATDAEGDPITYTLGAIAANGSVTVTDDGQFIYTPSDSARHLAAADDAPMSAKTDTFTVTASDGVASTSITVHVTIVPANTNPLITAVTMTNDANGVVTGVVTAIDSDGDARIYSGTGVTTHGNIVVTAAGTYTYTPTAAALEQAAAGADVLTDSFVVSVTDGHGGSTSTHVTVQIGPGEPNVEQPELPATVGAVNAATGVVSGTVPGAEPEISTVTYTLSNAPDLSVGAVALNTATGAFTFIPTTQARFDAWTSPASAYATFIVNASDGESSTPITVNVQIAPAAAFRVDTLATNDQNPLGSQGLAVGPDGRLYSTTYQNGTSGQVVVLNADGSYETTLDIASLVPAAVSTAYDVAAGPGGRIFVSVEMGATAEDIAAETGHGAVIVIDPENNYAAALFAQITEPASALTVDSSGNVYVANWNNDNITVLNADGTVNHIITSAVLSDGDDSGIAGMALAADGALYLTKPSLGVIKVINPDGTLGNTLNVGGTPWAIALSHNGVAYVSDAADGTVGVIDIAGNVIRTITLPPGSNPTDLAVGTDGTVYSAYTGADTTAISVISSAPVSHSDPTALGSSVAGLPAGSISTGGLVVANGVVYQTVVNIDPVSGALTTTVESITADGKTTFAHADGYATGPVVVATNGVAYQTISSYSSISGAPATGVLVISSAGDSTFTGLFEGSAAGSVLLGADGTVYQIVHPIDADSTYTTKVLAITSTGVKTYDIEGMPASIQLTDANAVVAPDGTLYFTTVDADSNSGAFTTRVAALTGTRMTTYTLGGYAVAPVTVAADGSIYQTTAIVSVDDTGAESTVTAVAIFNGSGFVTLPGAIAGMPVGGLQNTDAGSLYQAVVATDSESGTTTTTIATATDTGLSVVFEALPGTPIEIDGGVLPLAIGPDGTLYQTTASDPDPDTDAILTYVATRTPSDFVGGLQVAGQPLGPIIIGPDGTAYQATYDSGANTIRVAVITASGTDVHEFNGHPGNPHAGDLETAAAVIGGDGNAYLTMTVADPTTGAYSTVIAVISASEIQTYSYDGIPNGHVVVGAEGAMYQSVSVFNANIQTMTTTVLSVNASGMTPVGTPIMGQAGGPVVVGADGLLYQSVYAEGAAGEYFTSVHAVGPAAIQQAARAAVALATQATASPTVIGSIYVGGDPEGVAVSPDGQYIYVTNQDGYVSVIDTRNNNAVTTITTGSDSIGVAVHGNFVYVANRGSNTVSIIDVSNISLPLSLPHVVNVAVDSAPFGVAVSPNGRYVYVANSGSGTVSVIDSNTKSVIDTVPVGGSPMALAVSPNGTRVYVTGTSGGLSVIDTADNSIQYTVAVYGNYGVSVSRNNRYVYVTQGGNGLSVVDVQSGTVSSIWTGDGQEWVAVSPNGKYVYVSNTGSGTVSVIEADTNSVVNEVPVGYVAGVAVSPDSRYVYAVLAGGGGSSVQVIGTGNYGTQSPTATKSVKKVTGTNPKPKTVNKSDIDWPDAVADSVHLVIDTWNELYRKIDKLLKDIKVPANVIKRIDAAHHAFDAVRDFWEGGSGLASGKNILTSSLKVVSGISGAVAAIPFVWVPFPPVIANQAAVKAGAFVVSTAADALVLLLNVTFPDL
ncbi:Ig-like domain-containing protein [Mycolicibacterium gilvum]|uniref:Ig-like domain-containing protein n=1 Tax=Mycolicibacterium gilvum TaxID=1804 RepID=UPI0040455A67